MDDALRALVRAAQQQDDPELNLRVVQALERSGQLADIYGKVDDQPKYPIKIRVRSFLDFDAQIEPVHFRSVLLHCRAVPWPARDWASWQIAERPFQFTLLTYAQAEKPPFNSLDLATFLDRWGSQREVFWLPLDPDAEVWRKQQRQFGAETVAEELATESTLPGVVLGGPNAQPGYEGEPRVSDQTSLEIARGVSDSIERWTEDHPREMAEANQRWNLFQIAIGVEAHKQKLEEIRQIEGQLNQKTKIWLHNSW